jgi:type II secretory ATPase GspE/PulE/Tfp pilus assembly ATPase PilB-like protein/CheY-like chemotaxis protein
MNRSTPPATFDDSHPGSAAAIATRSQEQGAHWLSSVALNAGLDIPLPLAPDRATLRRAWPAVVKACRASEDKFIQRAAAHFRIGVADLSTWDPRAVHLIPEAVARTYGVLAISFSDTHVVVATSDPTNRQAIKEIVATSGRQPVLLLASPAHMDRVLERAYAPARAPKNALQTLVAQVAASDFQIVTATGTGTFTRFDLEDGAVVKLADVILGQAAQYRATEVHVEPGRDGGRVRYRIDGVLQDVVELPFEAHRRLVGRLKLVAGGQPGLDPGDGFPVKSTSGKEDRRGHLLTVPTPDGELVSIQLVAPDEVPTLASLSYDGPEGEKIREILRRPDGLVLVTGPARAGTTSFVYACMGALAKKSVLSLESRIELPVPGVTQIRYDAASGRSFAETLQDLLDRRPDVLHAGEIRDLATARIAIRTAVTGRKVLATVHTADAASGLRRLTDMGIDGGRLGESCHAVISLRLVRRLCPSCKKPFDPADPRPSRERKLAEELGIEPVRLPIGCRECAGTGYLGQLPLAEVLILTPLIQSLLEGDASDEELTRAARKGGMRTFMEVGLDRVARGETTVEELERVLGVVPTQVRAAGATPPVLVVDDVAQDRMTIRTLLDDMGLGVVEAPDGTSARNVLDDGVTDLSLVLLDDNLPEMTGHELLRSLRRSLATQSLPVIVLSSSDDPRDEIALLEAGADDYLVKPINRERVEARVRAVLRRSGTEITS